jgi:hypothetical protein
MASRRLDPQPHLYGCPTERLKMKQDKPTEEMGYSELKAKANELLEAGCRLGSAQRSGRAHGATDTGSSRSRGMRELSYGRQLLIDRPRVLGPESLHSAGVDLV